MLEIYWNLTAIGYKWEEQNIEDHSQNSRRHRRYIICHSGSKPCEYKGNKKKHCTPVSLRTIGRDVVVPTMRRHDNCDTNLQLTGFPTSVGIHQQTLIGEKSHNYSKYETLTVSSSSLCTCSVSHSTRKCYAWNQCDKTLSYLQRCEETLMGRGSSKCKPSTKGFISHRCLQTHKTTSDEDDLYECNQCDKVFRSDSSVKVYQRTHLEVKPCEYSKSDQDFACHSLHQVGRIYTREKRYEYDKYHKVWHATPTSRRDDHNRILLRTHFIGALTLEV